jgi:hypothetical protein
LVDRYTDHLSVMISIGAVRLPARMPAADAAT